MDSYHITGGKRLAGEHRITGAKNAVLPILAGAVIPGGVSKIRNCPRLSDVDAMVRILEGIGCRIRREDDSIEVDAGGVDSCRIPEHLMKEMRSSVFLMGPLLARCGEVVLSHPGGCEIGRRPIDIHISALRKLGVEIRETDGGLACRAANLKGTEIRLEFPSVGATENLMMAAVAARGETRILNPAREPEIRDLQDYLVSCGASVEGAGGPVIRVRGAGPLKGAEHRVMPDRIEAGTLLAAAAITGGQVLLTGAMPEDMEAVLEKFREAGCLLRTEGDKIELSSPPRLRAVDSVVTQPYPGFPTDMQSQFLALMTVARGECRIRETIFENRFKPAKELLRMGADIRIEGPVAVVRGVEALRGARVAAGDLRGGAALTVAGLAAPGETFVENVCHIDRGYDKLEVTLRKLGAEIRRIEE
ncbi:MAG: UDP-N-acetylglucosamine 1-carboxyvinyltransferase [Bacillota bacterium]|nr:UDP-N-acetylglucosamine 1-carboxyvinyltransferase [Bacillota bacterium]